MRRVLPFLLVSLLAGCASTPRYASDGGDYYYDDPAPDIVLVPDYFAYNAYYSALWPVYHGWWDPFYAPGFYYGVTFFPHYYSGWGKGWPYYAYSPWWSGHWDYYYDWTYWQHRYPGVYAHRYGSAQNEAIAAAQLTQRSYVARKVGSVAGLRDDHMPVARDAYYGAPRIDRGSLVDRAVSARRAPATRPHYGPPMERGGVPTPVYRNRVYRDRADAGRPIAMPIPRGEPARSFGDRRSDSRSSPAPRGVPPSTVVRDASMPAARESAPPSRSRNDR